MSCPLKELGFAVKILGPQFQ